MTQTHIGDLSPQWQGPATMPTQQQITAADVTHPSSIKRLIEEFHNRSPMRATSLIISVFGDTVSQHGGVIWLGSLVDALAPLGIDERLVRTSVFRLVKDEWLASEKIGRKSYYRFTDYGLHEYQRAARRIYNLEPHPWNGNWQLVIPQDIPEEQRESFRRSLQWQGFRSIASGVFARPDEDNRELLETIEEFTLANRVVLINGQVESLIPKSSVREMVQLNWKLDEVATHYKSFIKHYRPLHKWLQKNNAQPLSAYIARTLLIHDYRRILLQDTPLPGELLPQGWPGSDALAMAGEIYQAVTEPSLEYICGELEGDAGKLPSCGKDFYKRFARNR